jgi:hypothetical protein
MVLVMEKKGNLQLIVDAAFTSMCEQPVHDLSLGFRHAVYDALGERKSPNQITPSPAHQRRLRLAYLSVQKALPLWQPADLPQGSLDHILAYIERRLTGSVVDAHAVDPDMVIINEWLGFRYWHDILDDFTSTMLGCAVIELVAVAQRDEEFSPGVIDYELSDAKLRWFFHDTAFYSAAAYAGGLPWDQDSNPLKRKEFWTWWLMDGVRGTSGI